MKTSRFPSYVLVAAQLALLAAIAIPDVKLHFSLGGALLLAGGMALGIWALALMGRHLRIMPEPAAGAKLLQHGPYRMVRHPMYSAGVLAATGWLLCDFSWSKLACLLALLPVPALKAAREERLLGDTYPNYTAYRSSSWRFIPWVW